MRYRCLACDHGFDVAAAESPRCPKCFRIHGLEPEADASKSQPAPGGRLWLYVGVAIVLAGGGLVAYRVLGAPGTPVPGVAADDSALQKQAREKGVEGTLPNPLAADEAVTRLASAAKGGDARARVLALGKLLRELVDGKKLTASGFDRAPDRIRTAAELARDLAAGKGDRATSFELAALAVTALRSQGHKASLVEIVADGKKSGDPSGRLGAYAAQVELGAEKLIVDPFAGRGPEPKGLELRPMSDLGALAGFLVGRAAAANDPQAGHADAEKAVKLEPDWAIAQSAFGVVLLGAGGAAAGQEALRKAVALRDRAPQRRLLAFTFLVAQEVRKAEQEIDVALERDPDDTRSLVMKAQVKLIDREVEAAEKLLARARELEPGLGDVVALSANLALVKGNAAEAESLLKARIDTHPEEEAVRIGLADLMLRTGKTDEAFKLAEDGIKHSRAPDKLKERIAQLRKMVAEAGAGGGAGAAAASPSGDGGAAAAAPAPTGDAGAAAPADAGAAAAPEEKGTPAADPGGFPEIPRLQLQEPGLHNRKPKLRLE